MRSSSVPGPAPPHAKWGVALEMNGGATVVRPTAASSAVFAVKKPSRGEPIITRGGPRGRVPSTFAWEPV